MIDLSLQRKNMVESQVRPSDVTDRRIMRAMLEVPRERFVPKARHALAYMDEAVSLGADAGGRALLSARLLAKMIQLMEIGDKDVVLDIGGASGYDAAILARIAQMVVVLEQDPALATSAGTTLSALGVDNVAIVTGPHREGFAQEGPYDAILLAGAVAEVPSVVLDQLKDGGRLVAVVGEPGQLGRVVQWRRLSGTFDRRVVSEAGAPALPGFEKAPTFTL